MRINFRDRLILSAGGVLAIVNGLVLWAFGLRIAGLTWDMLPGWVLALCLVCGALTVLWGIYLLFFCLRRMDRRSDYVTQKTDHGELRIAVKAIEHMVLKCIDLHHEVRLGSMAIVNARRGVTVDLTVSLANNISIPLAIAALQKQIKQYLAASSGIEVKEVRVSVQASEEEWEAPSAGSESNGEEDRAEGSKRPLHQRLFSPSDQPMILPQPPSQEADAMDAWRPPETELAKPSAADESPSDTLPPTGPESESSTLTPPDTPPADEYPPEAIDGGSKP